MVDDGSPPATAEVVRKCRHPNLRYSRKVNGGPASARNLGIQLATTPLIAFTDEDCVALEGWPLALAKQIHLEGNHGAGVGGRVVSARDGMISRYCLYYRILEPPPSVSYLVTANRLFRREALLEVEGFDARIHSPGGDNPDLPFAYVVAGTAWCTSRKRASLTNSGMAWSTSRARFTGTAGDVPLSWADDLRRARLAISDLLNDLRAGYADYHASQLPALDLIACLCHRVIQRAAYSLGLRAGQSLPKRPDASHRQGLSGVGNPPGR